MSKPVRLGFVKLGNIAAAPLIEMLLDERADREDIDVRVVGSGAKMGDEQAAEVTARLIEFKPDLAVVTSPNAALPGPTKARRMLSDAGIPTIVVSDSPAQKVKDELEGEGFGYIIITADAMIGARREFLDPVEMALFNADVIRVLAGTGVFALVYKSIDEAIQAMKKGSPPSLPRMIVDKQMAVDAAGYCNPYAQAKAMAAFEISKKVTDLTVEGCFKVKEWESYTKIVAAAHEMMRQASALVDEAREIEKAGDTVSRQPHKKTGEIVKKLKLMEKPS